MCFRTPNPRKGHEANPGGPPLDRRHRGATKRDKSRKSSRYPHRCRAEASTDKAAAKPAWESRKPESAPGPHPQHPCPGSAPAAAPRSVTRAPSSAVPTAPGRLPMSPRVARRNSAERPRPGRDPPSAPVCGSPERNGGAPCLRAGFGNPTEDPRKTERPERPKQAREGTQNVQKRHRPHPGAEERVPSEVARPGEGPGTTEPQSSGQQPTTAGIG